MTLITQMAGKERLAHLYLQQPKTLDFIDSIGVVIKGDAAL